MSEILALKVTVETVGGGIGWGGGDSYSLKQNKKLEVLG